MGGGIVILRRAPVRRFGLQEPDVAAILPNTVRKE